MVWVGAVIVLVVALAAWWWWARYTRGLQLQEIARHIEEFAGYSGRGGVLEIRHEGSSRMLQFALRNEAEGKRLLEFGLPDMPWSEQYFDQIVRAAESAGFRCSVEQGSKNAPVRRLLSVVYGGDSDDLGEGTRELELPRLLRRLGWLSAAPVADALRSGAPPFPGPRGLHMSGVSPTVRIRSLFERS